MSGHCTAIQVGDQMRCSECVMAWDVNDSAPPDCTNNGVLLLDIDNCISDDGWRIPRINWATTDSMKRYFDYHALAPWDKPDNLDLFTGRAERIVLLTSRPVAYRVMTEHWLRRASVPYVSLLMRNNGDLRPSTAVKREHLDQLWHYGVHKRQIVGAYDDRPEIVAMYHAYGIPAEVRACHSASAYHDPKTGINHADGSREVLVVKGAA